MSLKLNIAYNKTTKQLIGYSNPKNGQSIVVMAYAVDDLEKRFKKAVSAQIERKNYVKNHQKALQYMVDCEEKETKLMIQASKNDKV